MVGDDWKAVLLWRALYDAGVYVNVAIHPAVPPGGALLRTSVMATHDRAVLDRALAAFENVKRNFEREHGPLPEPRRIAHSPDDNASYKSLALCEPSPRLSVASAGDRGLACCLG